MTFPIEKIKDFFKPDCPADSGRDLASAAELSDISGDIALSDTAGGSPEKLGEGSGKLSVGFYLFLAFFVPFILMFFAFAAAGVSPFGTNQILVTDLWHQYYPFLVDYQDKLQHGGSLLWTWKSGGGTNYLALMAYYLASPLNLFSVFVPARLLREFLFVITCVKIGFAGFSFAMFLKLTFKRRDLSIAAFGIMYALCAFIMGYYWNVIWLDTVALLPLVIAGTFALLRDGKFRLYIITLALSILANYYIGLFTCAFVFLVCVGYTAVNTDRLEKAVKDLCKMVVCSAVAIMISAALTLPAYYALGHTYSSVNKFPADFAVNIGSTADLSGVLEALGKIISNSVAFLQPTAKEGLPNIYCGVFTIFLAILFFFCSKISLRERVFCGALVMFFMLSFISRRLDYIWHGMHFPNMLPHRFSFLYSFALIYMAFRVYQHLECLRLSSVVAAICGFTAYLGVAEIFYDRGASKLANLFTTADGVDNPDPVTLSAFFGLVMAAWVTLFIIRNWTSRLVTATLSAVIGTASMVFVLRNVDLIIAVFSKGGKEINKTAVTVLLLALIACGVILIFCVLSSDKLNAGNRMFRTVLSVVVMTLALVEGVISSAVSVNTVSVTGASYYPLGTTDTLAMSAKVRELEQDNIDLPRTEVNKYYTLNDNALDGLDGISMFNSMVNSRITVYMEKFGLCGWEASNRYTYQESSPFTNLMLNLKYIISPYGAYLDTMHNTNIASSGSVKLMRNEYYVPMGFMVDDALLAYDVDSAKADEPLENQNNFFRLATRLEDDLYDYLDYDGFTAGEGASVDESSPGKFSYSSSSSSDSYQLNYTAPRDGVAVAYYSCYGADNASLRVNDEEVISYYIKRPFIMMIGDVDEGDRISCSASMSNSSSGTITCRVAMINEDVFTEAYTMFKNSSMKASKVTGSSICGNINAQKDGLFYTSIPYVEGWKAYVDGCEVEITPVGDAMLAFSLTRGPHIIEIRYTPEGFKSGLLISFTGILIFILMIVFRKRLIKFAQVSERASADGAYEMSYGDHTSPDAAAESDYGYPTDPTHSMNDSGFAHNDPEDHRGIES